MLRHDLGARYKRLRKVPYLGNADRCLILRAHFSKFLLNHLAAGMRVINLDQTWINDMNFTRRKWRMRGQAETAPESKVTPRVSLQMAICTDGRLYSSMYQVNTDARVFCLFISKLVAVLSKEDRRFRESTILMIDGAKY